MTPREFMGIDPTWLGAPLQLTRDPSGFPMPMIPGAPPVSSPPVALLVVGGVCLLGAGVAAGALLIYVLTR